ncbi:MAG: hypothetical protein JKY98_03985, partial [Gammaproteobacteria bacterium]|nr:hypothetical protein [Gammaproteobacteria bacterium]
SIIGGTPEVAVYDQSLELEVLLHRCEGQADDLQSNSIGLKLQVQLCNNQLCLPPETLSFRV